MTIIVFLIDNSASMNQRTIQGTTLLDVAKSAVELFFKIRLSKSRVDRYFILTLDPETNYMKLADWRQNVDLQCLHIALNNIKANGRASLSEGLQRTFRMLNLNRLQLGLENYGMGMFPSYIEPAVILCITDGCGNFKFDESVLKDISLSSIEPTVFGQALTNAPFRWDYRLYSIILRYPALLESISNSNVDVQDSPILQTSELTGGRGYVISDNRELQQSLESLALKCQPAVVMDFVSDVGTADSRERDITNSKSVISYKQLVFVKLMGRVCSNWPIPEPFWPDDELISTHLPPRSPHPKIIVSPTQVIAPNMPEYFPLDRYELEPSTFTQYLCGHDPNKVWQCFGYDSKHQTAPFGFLKLSSDLQTAHLHVLPYNYPVFCQLLNELYEIHHMRMSEVWGHQFIGYLSSIPRYYFMPLTKAFERFGFQSVIKPEAIDRVLPYQLKHSLQKLRHAAKLEYDNFVKLAHNEEAPPTWVTLPPQSLPYSLWSLRDLRPCFEKHPRPSHQPYARAADVDRRELRCFLRTVRNNLDDIFRGIRNDRRDSSVHQQPVATMGDYMNYKMSHECELPLREVNPPPERLDTFGNPFRKKSASLVVDEVFVDEMGLSPNVPGGPNASLVSPIRKKQHALSSNAIVRNKGPLPPYINHLNWREFSPKNSPPGSPRPINNCADEKPVIPSTGKFPSLPNSDAKHLKNKDKVLSTKEAFTLNEKVVKDLTDIIRQPCTGDSNVMVLVIEDRRYSFEENSLDNYLDWLCSLSSLKEDAIVFTNNLTRYTSSSDLLYVHQGEMATVLCNLEGSNHKVPRLLASDDATSCVIVVLRSLNSCTIAHLDGIHRVRSFFAKARRFLSNSGTVNSAHVYMVGGFNDERNISRQTLVEVLREILFDSTREYLLKTFCVAELNTKLEHCNRGDRKHRLVPFPIVTGLSFDWHTNTAVAAKLSWEARGPVPSLRLSRLQSSDDALSIVEVFHPINCWMVIKPFNYAYDVLDDPENMSADTMRNLSTTPDQEPDTFFEGLRAALTLMYRCPNSMTWFTTGPLHFYLPDTGNPQTNSIQSSISSWIPLDKNSARAIQNDLTNITPRQIFK
ncbi:integrator complex subunit 6 [Paragonimus westermani]|uniref:Integrator complex subunit 6 n=1 Tax=Paragonimus westermani TaxID=34504 RepID=A0A5J4NHX2_9TREM|nr:integrator complex subunit 6 [Paragonimus westermani]